MRRMIGAISALWLVTSVLSESQEYQLRQNCLHPFTSHTRNAFGLPWEGVVKLSVYILMGQKLAVLAASQQWSVAHLVTRDGGGDAGIWLRKEFISDG